MSSPEIPDVQSDIRRAYEQIKAGPLVTPRRTLHHPKCAIYDGWRERGWFSLADCSCGGWAYPK